jgi:hypothetical protein
MKGDVMSIESKKKSPLELANLVLKHKPGASIGMTAKVISEWGDLFDDHRFGIKEFDV